MCLSVSCVQEILKADPGQLQAEDSLYGGTPLHWSKTAEVIKRLTSWVLCLEIHSELFKWHTCILGIEFTCSGVSMFKLWWPLWAAAPCQWPVIGVSLVAQIISGFWMLKDVWGGVSVSDVSYPAGAWLCSELPQQDRRERPPHSDQEGALWGVHGVAHPRGKCQPEGPGWEHSPSPGYEGLYTGYIFSLIIRVKTTDCTEQTNEAYPLPLAVDGPHGADQSSDGVRCRCGDPQWPGRNPRTDRCTHQQR